MPFFIFYLYRQIYSRCYNLIKGINLFLNRQGTIAWLKYLGYKEEQYSIGSDLKVNLRGNFYLHSVLRQLPIQFGVVEGSFTMDSCQLKTLKGCPETVLGHFNVSNNQLKSLQYMPQNILKEILINRNQLTSLKYIPKEIHSLLKATDNCLTDIEALKDVNIDGHLMIDTMSIEKLSILSQVNYKKITLYGDKNNLHIEKLKEFDNGRSCYQIEPHDVQHLFEKIYLEQHSQVIREVSKKFKI